MRSRVGALANGHAGERELTADDRRELAAAIRWLIDSAVDDIAALMRGGSSAQATLSAYLPELHRERYSLEFVRHFLVCLVSVADRISAQRKPLVTCMADELALRAIIVTAEGRLWVCGRKSARLTSYLSDLADDVSCAHLFAATSSDTGERNLSQQVFPAGSAGLLPEDWFRPYAHRDTHLYVTR